MPPNNLRGRPHVFVYPFPIKRRGYDVVALKNPFNEQLQHGARLVHATRTTPLQPWLNSMIRVQHEHTSLLSHRKLSVHPILVGALPPRSDFLLWMQTRGTKGHATMGVEIERQDQDQEEINGVRIQRYFELFGGGTFNPPLNNEHRTIT